MMVLVRCRVSKCKCTVSKEQNEASIQIGSGNMYSQWFCLVSKFCGISSHSSAIREWPGKIPDRESTFI